MAEPQGIGVPLRMDTTGYPAYVVDADLIHDSIFTILSTVVGERVHQPTFGSFLKYLVFQPINRALVYRIQAEVRRAVRAWESRAEVTEVTVESPQDGVVTIKVTWVANGTLTGTTLVPFTISTEA